MSVLSANQSLESRCLSDRWNDLFARLTRAARQFNSARASGVCDDPSSVARLSRDLYELMRTAILHRYSPPLEKLRGWEVDLYRAAMCYAHLRATAEAGKQWAALQRLMNHCISIPSV